MKKQINTSVKAYIKTYLLPTLCILLSLLVIWQMPFAQAQRNTNKQSAAKSMTAAATELSATLSAGPVVNSPKFVTRPGTPPAPQAPNVVLYDQYNNAGANATLSATFTDFPTFSADLADDFTVPAATTWN